MYSILDANQGGLFLIETDENKEEVLDLKASFAYNRRKFLKKKAYLNEGLLGECVMGKEIIHLSEIPASYIEIVSGLGNSNPRFLLVVPLIFNEKVYGVVEIASFNKFEPHITEFVENASETIASTISMMKTNIQTSDLLEKSQQQAEILETRERELQQNLEELKSVHEQMDSNNKKIEEKEKNAIAILDGVLDGIITCMPEGEIVDMNPEFLRFTGYTRSLTGESIFNVFDIDNINNLKLNKEQTITLIRGDNTKEKVKAKFTKITKYDGINYLFLIRT